MTATLMGGLGSASIVTEERRDGRGAGRRSTPSAASACRAAGRSGPAPFEIGDEFGGLGAARGAGAALHAAADEAGAGRSPGNTTIAIVATDVALDKAGARRLAEAAHAGLARAIHPAHTPFDGDLVFAVSTGPRAGGAEPALEAMVLGHAAALCLARAIARAVWAARPAPGNLLPCWCEGRPWTSARVRLADMRTRARRGQSRRRRGPARVAASRRRGAAGLGGRRAARGRCGRRPGGRAGSASLMTLLSW